METKFKSAEQALIDLEKRAKAFEKLSYTDLETPEVFEEYAMTFGPSIISLIHEICEDLLFLVCLEYADPNGLLLFPRVEDLARRNQIIDVSKEVIDAAKTILRLRRILGGHFDTTLTPNDIVKAFKALNDFAKWAESVTEGKYEDEFSKLDKAFMIGRLAERRYEDFCSRTELNNVRLGMLYKGGKPASDEDVDRIDNPNLYVNPKQLVPIYIIRTLKKHSTPTRPLKQKEIEDYLDEDEEIKIERKALRRYLYSLCLMPDFSCHMQKIDREYVYWFDDSDEDELYNNNRRVRIID